LTLIKKKLQTTLFEAHYDLVSYISISSVGCNAGIHSPDKNWYFEYILLSGLVA